MPRRVQPGDRLAITAADYNRLLAAAETIHRNRLPGGGGPRTHLRNASTVRIHNTSAETVPIGGIVGFDTPLTDPTVGPAELARFVRDATIQCVKPTEEEHSGRVGVAIEPIAADKVGRVVFDGVVAARVNVTKTWHRFADVGETAGDTLQSKPDGSAQILWRHDRPSGSASGSGDGSHRSSEDDSTHEPSGHDSGSSESCESTWIWSCGWELVDSTCEDAGAPPSGSGSYDGEVAVA